MILRQKKINDKKAKAMGIDKNSIQYLKYKDIALEFIKSGYNNIRGIYHKYYPKASNYSIDCEAYRLLDNDRFKIAMEEAWQEIKIEDLDVARTVIHTLHDIAVNGKKESDRINAASWLGKTVGQFVEKTENKTTITDERRLELTQLASRISITN